MGFFNTTNLDEVPDLFRHKDQTKTPTVRIKHLFSTNPELTQEIDEILSRNLPGLDNQIAILDAVTSLDESLTRDYTLESIFRSTQRELNAIQRKLADLHNQDTGNVLRNGRVVKLSGLLQHKKEKAASE